MLLWSNRVKGLIIGQNYFQTIRYFPILKTVLTSAKSVDPYERSHYAAIHLGLHSLTNYPFSSFRIQRVKWSMFSDKLELVRLAALVHCTS